MTAAVSSQDVASVSCDSVETCLRLHAIVRSPSHCRHDVRTIQLKV
jgi:hypothetical protein